MKEQLPDKWQAGEAPKVCEQCSFVGEDGFHIKIHPDVLGVAFALCKEIDVEWQILLSGSVNGNDVLVTGYYVTKQEVGAAHVKNLDNITKKFIEDNDIVATMHSHANMDVFFSPTDDEFTNMNFIKHHAVINNKHEFVAKSRHDLPCGGVKFVVSVVETMIPTVKDVVGVEKIKKYEYPAHQQSEFSGFHTGEHVPYNQQVDHWKPEYGYWEGGVWVPAEKTTHSNSFYGSRYVKVNGVYMRDEVAY